MVGREEFREHADGLGEYMAHPIAMQDFIATVTRLLSQA